MTVSPGCPRCRMTGSCKQKIKTTFSEFSNVVLFLVVSGFPSHTCRTAKGQNCKVKSKVVLKQIHFILHFIFHQRATGFTAVTNFLESPESLCCYLKRASNRSNASLPVNSCLEGYGGKLLKLISTLPDNNDVNFLTMNIF